MSDLLAGKLAHVLCDRIDSALKLCCILDDGFHLCLMPLDCESQIVLAYRRVEPVSCQWQIHRNPARIVENCTQLTPPLILRVSRYLLPVVVEHP